MYKTISIREILENPDAFALTYKYKLCYIGSNESFSPLGTYFAYFTQRDGPKVQWGDNWGVAPYEHYSGLPYTKQYNNGSFEEETIIVVPFLKCKNLLMPHEITKVANSVYSVDMINSGAAAWLFDVDSFINIPAGLSILDFVVIIDTINNKSKKVNRWN